MPRENSFSDSEGRSLTPDLDEEVSGGISPTSPTYSIPQNQLLPEPSFNSAPKESTEASAPSMSSLRKKDRTGPSTASFPTATRPELGPRDRFRASVRKVMTMRRSTTLLLNNNVGAEPGVDPRRATADIQYGGIKQDCVIELVDYSSTNVSYGRMTNKELVNLLSDKNASARQTWAKVRWINIGGLSWDVVKAISLKYDIHPLALEDVFHTRSQTRSKVDYYNKHLFLRILCHELGDPNGEPKTVESAAYGSTLTDGPRSSSPLPFEDGEGYEMIEKGDKSTFGSSFGSRKSNLRHRGGRNKKEKDLEEGSLKRAPSLFSLTQNTETRQQRREEEVSIAALKKGERVVVDVSPMHIFLFRDGTVISMHSNSDLTLTQPITRRLQQRDTMLRTSADPSLLVQSLLDLIVDKALEVIDEYHLKIKRFERQVLLRPEVSTVRNLHILSGDLILHKRTLEPIKTVVYGLRRYDLDRAAALVDQSLPANKDLKIVGFMSHKSKIYLADVYDHMEYILTSIEMFAGITENLINYTFNMTSYEMNEVMRRLTLATIVFLPLTLLTGYFGMNFEFMWSVHNNSDVLFWEIAIPVMLVVIPMFLMPDLKRMLHYIEKRMVSQKALKSYKRL
ncbi:magnesium transporter [Lentinula aff. detonsa]|uniref:Magnesium transporter n=1 Tax=Lentinula aff. detonsa TaxID=2804958 RepID=A0AA38NKA9_9AGAR|nr:magnesium transporter [Lentinula aff. detonsa]